MMPAEKILKLCQEAAPSAPQSCPITADVAELRSQLRAMQESITSFTEKQLNALDAFPEDDDGRPDVSGHRHFHEALIEQSKARAEFWRKMTFELAKWGLIGFAAWSLRELWLAFIHGPAGK
jgi:hypothetical protein